MSSLSKALTECSGYVRKEFMLETSVCLPINWLPKFVANFKEEDGVNRVFYQLNPTNSEHSGIHPRTHFVIWVKNDLVERFIKKLERFSKWMKKKVGH
ncbi:hypothetical protein KKE60_08535 [Patescibacteria group bacterium]|nr:hypothetical protein [Patescibacteria group bacterium]